MIKMLTPFTINKFDIFQMSQNRVFTQCMFISQHDHIMYICTKSVFSWQLIFVNKMNDKIILVMKLETSFSIYYIILSYWSPFVYLLYYIHWVEIRVRCWGKLKHFFTRTSNFLNPAAKIWVLESCPFKTQFSNSDSISSSFKPRKSQTRHIEANQDLFLIYFRDVD